MQKNNRKIFLFVFCFMLLFPILSINAQEFECEYPNFKLNISDYGNIGIQSDYYEDPNNNFVLRYLFSSLSNLGFNIDINKMIPTTSDLEYQLEGLKYSCPKRIYVCRYNEYSFSAGFTKWVNEGKGIINSIQKIMLFKSEQAAEEHNVLKGLKNNELTISGHQLDFFQDLFQTFAINGEYLGNGELEVIDLPSLSTVYLFSAIIPISQVTWPLGADIAYVKYKSCGWEEYQGDAPTYNLACSNLNVLLESFLSALDEYDDCDPTNAACKSQKVTIINQRETKVKDYCNTILENYDYDGDTEQDCLDACFDVGLNMIKSKKEAGLLSTGSGECGVSARLLVWASNILRWIKYILPVVAIVLGMLDFIKAIGADKEDEMKKAQSKFIKRLIAAALVFLVPLILEFVLDKMGFGYNACGLF